MPIPDPKNRILKVPLPAELYDQLEAAAAADDRDLERYVVRMVKQYLMAPPPVITVQPIGGPAYVVPAAQVFPAGPAGPANPTGPPVGRVIPLAIKGGGEGLPIDLMSDNALNGESEELVNPNVTPVRVPQPNPNAPDMFGPSHRK